MLDPSEVTIAPDTAAPGNKVLSKMLERLMAVLINGPSLNCRPHNSRQRVDFAQFKKLADLGPEAALEKLLGEARKVTIKARVPQPKRRSSGANRNTSPSPGTPGEGRGEGRAAQEHEDHVEHEDPHPGPLPEYQERGESAVPGNRVPVPREHGGDDAATAADAAAAAAENAAERAWSEQNALLNKLHGIAEDARTYEQDTGVYALNVGFPLLSLPPGSIGAAAGAGIGTRRIIAPVAFIPVTLTVKRGSPRAIELACRGEGVDLVIPNSALLSWIEQQTGKSAVVREAGEQAAGAAPANGKPELFSDETGEDPWREIGELTRFVCAAMDVEVPGFFADPARVPLSDAPLAASRIEEVSTDETSAKGEPGGDHSKEVAPSSAVKDPTGSSTDAPPRPALTLSPAPRADESMEGPSILSTAILGLFPMANQGLLRDTQAMVAEGAPAGPVQSFVRVGASLDVPAMTVAAPDAGAAPRVPGRARQFATERLIANADPCQSRAVRLARESAGLVVHGPPGTGKSQTITNIIGDHLARGQRVLLVCEKRTALDVVANRLRHMGLENLIAIVHDPRRDQRELYRTLRQQLDDLSEAQIDDGAAAKLAKVDADLQKLHDELSEYHAALISRPSPGVPGEGDTVRSAGFSPSEPTSEEIRAKARATNHSFHDLVGQWLDTMSAVESGLGLEAAAADAISALGLAALEEQLHDIEEIMRRGHVVGWATNPWREAATADLPAFLTRSADAHRAAVAGCIAPARAADASLVPEMPAFVPGVDLKQQADARVTLAERLESLAKQAAPAVLSRWSARPFSAVKAARAALTEAGPYIEVFEAGPLDAELLEKASRSALPAPARTAAQVAALQKYADAYARWAARLAEIMSKSPGAPLAVVARWVLAEPAAAEMARKRLDAAASLAGRAASAPLDAELLPVFRRQPFDLPQLLLWQSALETYLQIASTWHAFFHFGRRREATPVVQFFGLPLSAAAGMRVRDFLVALRLRLEVREALDAALGRKSSADLEDDEPLLGGFAQHRAVVTASAGLDRQAVPAAARSADEPGSLGELVNLLVPPEHAAAAPVLAAYDLPSDAAGAIRLRSFLRGLRARRMLQDLYERVLVAEGAVSQDLMGDEQLAESLRTHTALIDLILWVGSNAGFSVRSAGLSPSESTSEAIRTKARTTNTNAPGVPGEGEEVAGDDLPSAFAKALADAQFRAIFLDALRRSPQRAAAIQSLLSSLAGARVFDPAWLASLDLKLRSNAAAGSMFDDLAGAVGSLESVVRIRAGVARLPGPLRGASANLLARSADGPSAASVLRHSALNGEIHNRLAASPILQEVDGQRIEASFERYHRLVERKQQLVRDAVRALWVGRQKERLLSNTGSRLNALGAELRRRLTLRGERAMRLRRVIEVGRRTPGGDPLLDLCPVWMVSPETAAQVFPREPIFDAVVFDEASQCRLEEALPVLTRGARVVIAGDPQQLPPTRFFESAVTQSEDEDPQTDQELFETQQAEVEDLLGAALGLDIGQCYLDVHYRSRSEALIAFSNAHFYHNRLQSLPAHPSRRATFAAVTMYRADGIYDKRRNEAEADRVCQIVKELLDVGKRQEAPSIGIACFNLPQRDLIVERLDEAAADDLDFAKRLEAARERTGAGSFEGLFIKNLENVQGDERDHIIISTTYGPDKTGKFYRRFGPVGMPGGGRRLNVLVTRARDRVHLVTSIPPEAYRYLPPPQPGQTPGGGWLLFAYLRYAEGVGRSAETAAPETTGTFTADVSKGDGEGFCAEDSNETSVESAQVLSQIGPTRARSAFVEAMARRLAKTHNVPSDVYWGNDGFCVDLLLHNADGGDRPAVTGVLCDAARYPAAEDPMEWDIFRSAILKQQGWELHRLWSPHVFRDPSGAIANVARSATDKR